MVRLLTAIAISGIVALPLRAGDSQPSRASTAAQELLDRYASGDYKSVDAALGGSAGLSQLYEGLQGVVDTWVNAGGAAGVLRRRLIIASVALEAAGRHLEDPSSGRQLIEWGAAQLAQDAPRESERVWYLAAVAVSQSAYDPLTSWDLPSHALERFPDEDRFHLARALARELASWRTVQQAQRLDGRKAGAGILNDLAHEFEALLARKTIRAEVHLRLGHTYLRLGRPAVALEHLGQVEPLTNDPFLRYLARYFTGRAKLAAGDRAGAAAAFRDALAIVPRAQSASFALAALAFVDDVREDAYATVRSALSGAEPVDDPWRLYQTGDARFWPAFIDRLRKEIR